MVTEKMITDAANALGKYGVYVGASAMKYALEAALSADAEPVAWFLEANNTAYVFYPHEKERAEKCARLQNATLKPLYAAPPAPSVAVKALEEVDRLAEAGLCASSFSGARAFHEDIRAKVNSALSAQVQDVP